MPVDRSVVTDIPLFSGLAPGDLDEILREARSVRYAKDTPVFEQGADALSFFSLNSPGYVDYFGPAQALRKIQYSYARMDDGARARLSGVRLRSDVERMVQIVTSRQRTEKGDCA